MTDVLAEKVDEYQNDSTAAAEDRFKFKIIPVDSLSQAKKDILKFFEVNKLNALEKGFYQDDCMLDLPELDFKPVSIIIIAAKMGIKLAKFNYSGRCVTDMFRVRKANIGEYMNEMFAAKGYNFKNFMKLPIKRLAVCSGLAKYEVLS